MTGSSARFAGATLAADAAGLSITWLARLIEGSCHGQRFSVDDIAWRDLKGLPGARGFEFKSLSDGAYTTAFSAELVRLEPGDHSVPHVERWNHLLYVTTGTGDVTIAGETWPVTPGTVCLVKAGELHSLRNLGDDDMVVMTVYDPPRDRSAQKD